MRMRRKVTKNVPKKVTKKESYVIKRKPQWKNQEKMKPVTKIKKGKFTL
jgi:hypothetical protein